MLLTKKGLTKILVLSITSFVLGTATIVTALVFNICDVDDYFGVILKLGILEYVICLYAIFVGRYAEGKGIHVNKYNELVRKQLKPAEFISYYESLKNSTDLVINKPSAEILHLLISCYDILDDRENAILAVEQMLAVSGNKKKNYAKLIKAALLFSYDRIEEAEALLNEVQSQKLDFMCTALVDDIMKSDRAMAIGDYKTVELYNLKLLERKFPKLDNLTKLIIHYKLGEVYEKMQDNSKAVTHFQYCADFGGQTALKKSAMDKLVCLV